jgi:hypothetical protein
LYLKYSELMIEKNIHIKEAHDKCWNAFQSFLWMVFLFFSEIVIRRGYLTSIFVSFLRNKIKKSSSKILHGFKSKTLFSVFLQATAFTNWSVVCPSVRPMFDDGVILRTGQTHRRSDYTYTTYKLLFKILRQKKGRPYTFL